jgi:DivIVA domain-containing protein
MLTTADIEQKTFSTALRGYDLDEVDDFLDEIVTTIRTLTEQLDEARGAAEAVITAPVFKPESVVVPVPGPETEPEPEPEPVAMTPPPEIDESAIGRALVAAQNAADRLLEDARSEAGKIVEGAKSEADSWSAEREAKRREAEAEIARLTDRVASVRSELSVLAGEVAEKLDEMDSAIHEGFETGVDSFGDGGETVPEGGAALGEGEEMDDEPAVERWGYSVEEEPTRDAEPETAPNGADHLDAMLSGVANDLQLTSDEPGSHEPESQDDYPEGPDGDVDEEDE